MIKNKLHLLLALLLVLTPFWVVEAEDVISDKEGLRSLLKSFAQKKYTKIAFRESKSSPLLLNDIELQGEMLFQHPDYLMKLVQQPHQERFELKDGMVTYQRGGNEVRTLELSDYPLLNAFVVGYTAVLHGDLARLQQYYRLEFDKRDYAWRLRLYPRQEDMRELVQRLEFMGSVDDIQSILVYETSGDISTTNFLH